MKPWYSRFFWVYVKATFLLRVLWWRPRLRSCPWDVQFWSWPRIHHPENLSIGRRVAINDDFWVNAKGTVEIGDHVLIGPSVIIHSANHNMDRRDIPIRDQGHTPAKVVIEENVWLGARVTVLPGVTVGRGAVVAAGAVVTKDVAPYTIVAGVPAKHLRDR
jgi:acetyltransferase-like isoleucine patch superfamily enzyme